MAAVYELRIYRCMPGRKADVLARFRNHTMGFFKRYEIECVGFWETIVGDLDDLVYVLKWESMAEREKKWTTFQADPERSRVMEESHRNGVIVEHARSAFLEATDFSPPV
jgi:NIPSNAP protein